MRSNCCYVILRTVHLHLHQRQWLLQWRPSAFTVAYIYCNQVHLNTSKYRDYLSTALHANKVLVHTHHVLYVEKESSDTYLI